MTPADIERMAREAGARIDCTTGVTGTPVAHYAVFTMEQLQRFAAQVAAETEAATRRACAQVAAAYGPSRPILARNPQQLVRGRWEGEQAASAGIAAAILDGCAPQAVPGCGCEKCRPNTLADMRMIVCAKCGNKRCPHATDHRNACTGSNEPGQPGSSWAHIKPPPKPL